MNNILLVIQQFHDLITIFDYKLTYIYYVSIHDVQLCKLFNYVFHLIYIIRAPIIDNIFKNHDSLSKSIKHDINYLGEKYKTNPYAVLVTITDNYLYCLEHTKL